MPNLKTLRVNYLSTYSLRFISDFKYLNQISITFGTNLFKESLIVPLIVNCRRLRKINFDFVSDITIETIDRMIELANERPKQNIVIKCSSKEKQLKLNECMARIPLNQYLTLDRNENLNPPYFNY